MARSNWPVFWLDKVRREALRADAYLVPIRWFIGIGWLRSAAEKLFDPAWHDGDVLRDFLGAQAMQGLAAFPEFGTFLQTVVEPSAPLVSGLVLALQLICGAGILVGTFTNAALLIGMGMNLAFMLAGVPNPSAFYLLIQSVLFAANAGAIMGFDGRMLARERSLLIAARSADRVPRRMDRWCLGMLSGLLVVISIYSLAHGTDFSAAGAVSDPALVLGLVTALAGLLMFVTSLRPYTTLVVDLSERLANRQLAATESESTSYGGRLEDQQRQHSYR